MARPVMAKSSDIFEAVGHILEAAGGQIDQEIKQQYEREVKEALTHLNSTLQLTLDSIEDLPSPARLRKIMKSFLGVIVCLSNVDAVRASEELRHQCHAAYVYAGDINRALDLLDPSLSMEMRAKTLWWMAEQGTKEHLGQLLQIKSKLPNKLKTQGEMADQRMSERVSREVDPDSRLQTFFGLSQQEFAHLISTADWESKMPPSLREYTPLKVLQLIKEKLEGMVEKQELGRWLHARNPKFDKRTPIEAIKEGGAFQVLQLLIGLEEGIPD